MQDSILTTVVKDIDGEVTTLEKYAGNVLLIVNVASKCGLTPQYEQLRIFRKPGRSWFCGAGIPVQPVSGTRTGQR